MKNGISYITNSSDMTNSLYTNAFQSPLASYVDYYEKYSYSDPSNPNYKFTISKNKLGGGGDYSVTTGFPLWNPTEGKYEYQKVTDNITTYGANLEDARDMLINQFSLTKEQNKLLYNGNW
jgi:hypothetical protein